MPTTPREDASTPKSFEQRINKLAREFVTTGDQRIWTDMLEACVEAFQATTTPDEATHIWINIMNTCLLIPTKRNLANIAIAAVYEKAERKEGDSEVFDTRFAVRRKVQEGRTTQDTAKLIALNGRGYMGTRGWNPRAVLG